MPDPRLPLTPADVPKNPHGRDPATMTPAQLHEHARLTVVAHDGTPIGGGPNDPPSPYPSPYDANLLAVAYPPAKWLLDNARLTVVVYTTAKVELFRVDCEPSALRRTLRLMAFLFCQDAERGVTIHSPVAGWVHPDGRTMPADWNGWLPLRVEAKVGSANV